MFGFLVQLADVLKICIVRLEKGIIGNMCTIFCLKMSAFS